MSTINMSEEVNHNRRRFLRNATAAFAATIGSAVAQSSQTNAEEPVPRLA